MRETTTNTSPLMGETTTQLHQQVEKLEINVHPLDRQVIHNTDVIKKTNLMRGICTNRPSTTASSQQQPNQPAAQEEDPTTKGYFLTPTVSKFESLDGLSDELMRGITSLG